MLCATPVLPVAAAKSPGGGFFREITLAGPWWDSERPDFPQPLPRQQPAGPGSQVLLWQRYGLAPDLLPTVLQETSRFA